MKQEKIKAVVFDLDGTLLYTLEDLKNSGNELLNHFGREGHELKKYCYFVGSGSRVLVQRLFPDFSPEQVDDALEIYKKIYHRRALETTKPYEGIEDMLHRLREKKIILAVCTNKHQTAAKQLLEKFFPENFFDAYLGASPTIPNKPDPTNVNRLLKELNLQPSETAFMGDTSIDLQTAKNSHTLPIGVLWGFRPEEILAFDAENKIILNHPSELFAHNLF